MSQDPDDPGAPERRVRQLDPGDPLADDPARRRRRRRVLRDILIVAGVLLALGITFSIIQNFVRFMDRDDFTADGTESADIEVDDGDISITARGSADSARSATVETQVRYFLRKPDVRFEDDDTEARVRTSCEWPSNCDIDVSADVPRGTDATLRTDAGDLTVAGPAGVVDARASDGSITVDGALRDVRVAVADGDMSVANVSGAVRAEVTNGDLELASLSGPLRIRMAEGELTGADLTSTDAEIESGTGNVDLEFTGAPERVEIDIGAGNLTLSLPRGTYRLDESRGAGSIDTEGITEDPEAPNRIAIRSGEGNVTIVGS